MTIAGRREARFSDITKVRNLGTKFYAMSGKRQTVLVAQNTGGIADLVGETPSLGADARDIATNFPTSNTLYILTDDGMQIATLANTPVLGASVSFDPGDGRWILSTANAGTPYIVTPVDSGIQVLDQAGVRTSVSTPAGVAGCRDAVLGSDDVLYAVDEQRAKIHVWRITASKAVYIDSFRAKNCRDVIRMALDSTANILFVQCKHRIIGFNVAAAGAEDSAISVTLRQDYGNLKAEYTDFAKIGTNKYWIGVDADSALNAGPEYYGRTYAAWDTTNQVLFAAFPDMSIFAASNVVPYVGEIQIPPVPGIPDVPAIVVPPVVPLVLPPVVTPSAPVITSSLTASVTEDSIFNYVITATGTGPITYSLVSPPGWLTGLNSVTGAITGIPPDPGTVNVTIRATNAGGSDTRTLVVTVTNAIGNLNSVGVNAPLYGVAVIGTKIYVAGGGPLTSVTDASGTYARSGAACLDASTGLWTAWSMATTGAAPRLATDGTSIYIFGDLANVNGVASANRVVKVSATTGATDGAFSLLCNAPVIGVHPSGSELFLAGDFTVSGGQSRYRVSQNLASTGATTSWDATLGVNAAGISGRGYVSGGRVYITSGEKSTTSYGLNSLSASTAAALQMARGGGYNIAYRDICVNDSVIAVSYNANPLSWNSLPTAFDAVARSWLTYATLSGVILAAPVSMATPPVCIKPDFSTGFYLGGAGLNAGGDAARIGVVRTASDGSLITAFAPVWGAAGTLVGVQDMAHAVGTAIVLVGDWDKTINTKTRNHFAVLDANTGVPY